MSNLLKFLCAALLITAISESARCQLPGAQIDVTDYQYSVHLNDSNNIIYCEATITFRALDTLQALQLDLAGTMTLQETNSPYAAVTTSHDSDKVTFSFSRPIMPQTVVLLNVRYAGIPSDGLIISKNKFGRRTFFSDHWPNRARHWLLCRDHPSDKAAVSFSVTAPLHYQVISNGILTEETNINSRYKLTRWEEKTPIPTKVMCVGVAEFAVQHVQGKIPLSTWVFPENRDAGFNDFAVADSILSFFTSLVQSPYAFDKLANIQSKTIFGGMENAGAIFYSEDAVTGENKADQLIAHEVAHQWFGNMATELDWPHVWLSEGFATYLQLVYLRHKHGDDSFNHALQQNRKRIIDFHKKKQVPVVDSAVSNYMQLLNPNSYEKGGWVLHMLKAELGDSAFWKGVREYYRTFAGRNAHSGDFKQIMERSAGRSLTVFFRQWLFTAGHPVLRITQSYSAKERAIKLTVTQLQPATFEFPLTVAMGDAPESTKTVVIRQRKQEFMLPVSRGVKTVSIDPFSQLLYEAAD